METKSSHYIYSGIFSQLRENKLLNAIAFFSKNPNFAEYNYDVYDKKLLAII